MTGRINGYVTATGRRVDGTVFALVDLHLGANGDTKITNTVDISEALEAKIKKAFDKDGFFAFQLQIK